MSSPTIEPLTSSENERDCGCNFNVPFGDGPEGKTVLLWNAEAPAIMRIDGRLVALKVKTKYLSNQKQRPERIGDKVIYSLRGEGVSVVANCTAITVCSNDSKQESCESTQYRSDISVVSPKGKRSFSAWGECGC